MAISRLIISLTILLFGISYGNPIVTNDLIALNSNSTFNGASPSRKVIEKRPQSSNPQPKPVQTQERKAEDMTFTVRPYEDNVRAIDKWKLHNN